MPRHPPYALHSLSPHTQTQQKQDTQPTPKKRESRNVLSKTATKMLASTIQQPNNHKKTSRTPTIRRRDLRGPPDFSGPNSAPPNPPEDGPAPVSRACRPFHTSTPASRRTSSTEHSRPHQRGQHVDDSTSEHPNAGRTDAYRARVCAP